MTAVPHHVHGFAPAAPAEAHDPRNALLDAFEAQVEAMIANGLEPQLRTRLARLLPAPVRPRTSSTADDLHLRALSGASVLRTKAKAQRTKASADQFQALAGVLADAAAYIKGEH